MYIKDLSVTDVNNYLKKVVDNDFILSNLSVKGEISNFKLHTSGHLYFSLKDENSKVNCVMFRSDAFKLDFKMENGMKVIVKARLSLYVKDGSYQLYCKEIKKDGIGDLFVEYEKLKKKLFEGGFFDEEHKKAIPKFPSRVGVITSETGAAIQDIIKVIRRRNNFVDIILYPSLVQGSDAPNNLLKGLKYFNKEKNVDVIIIGRGGGSIEELWAFNSEELAMEIYRSKIPVISAVGHEVDFTICDFISDLRAATPSAAAEIAVPNLKEHKKTLEYYENILRKKMDSIVNEEKHKLNISNKILMLNSPTKVIAHEYEKIMKINEILDKSIIGKIEISKERIQNLNALLKAYNPTNILEKGYSIVQGKNGVIKSVDEVNIEDSLNVKLRDGNLTVVVKKKS
ncbi:Exodeoxyribonuclease VII large subunit [Clostridium cavendishii DSM 21758]|uniref:Exodeoxyribonuclease 7 large subunit n=1 Tax=Clostridium cavendishii DSM 21758 TaxID=1121302 RepID=A0A1M6KJX4_9CLOT|nr:exodeoxyribonuclease VII large subunit [Clostridium cavendishii]SHJ59268.1 Exodeoxyribonuclease VII large subunit [Clostridium cavendishii DSM 21758]